MFRGMKDRLNKEVQTVIFGQNLVDSYLRVFYRENEGVEPLCADIAEIIYRYRNVYQYGKICDSLSKVNIVELADRKYLVWISGSLLASTASFNEHWITKKQYEEHGSKVVQVFPQ